MAAGRLKRGFSALCRLTECPICLEKVSNHRMLGCQHVFCQECLEPLVENQVIKCPECREPCTLTATGVAGLPKNLVLVKVLETFCDKCMERKKEMRCNHCSKWLCEQCHSICEYSDKVDEVLSGGRSLLKTIEQERSQRQTRKREYADQIDKDIKRTIDTLMTKQSQIHRKFDQAIQAQVSQLDSMHGKVSEEITAIKSGFDKFKAKQLEQNVAQKKQANSDSEAWMTFLKNHSIKRAIPPDALDYLADVHLVQEIAETVQRLVGKQHQTKPTNYKTLTIRHDLLGSKGSANGQFLRPTYVAVSPVTKNIIVTDMGNNRIQIFKSASHQFVGQFGTKGKGKGQFDFGGLAVSAGVAVTCQGHIVVADSENHRLQIFNEQGQVLKTIGAEGTGQGEFNRPSGLSVHRDEIYVSDQYNNKIQVLDDQGAFRREFDARDVAGACLPCDVAVCPNGDVVVAVVGRDTGKLIVFNADGVCKATLCAGASQGSLKIAGPVGVTVDVEGNIIVTDCKTDQVHVLTQTGQLIKSLGSRGDKTGQLKGPIGVACAKDGSILVADCDNNRIQIFKFASEDLPKK